MAYLILDGKKQSISNLQNIENRCSCDANHYTLLKNPIYIVLREGKEPTLYKSTTKEPYSEKKYLGRAISFKGCVCELDKISESYRIFGARRPSQYNWGTLEVCKETGKNLLHGILPSEKYTKWEK